MSLRDLDWEDIMIHSGIGAGVGIIAGLSLQSWLVPCVAAGFLIWEGRQRIIKGQPMSHLFTGEQVIWEWGAPVVASLFGYGIGTLVLALLL